MLVNHRSSEESWQSTRSDKRANSHFLNSRRKNLLKPNLNLIWSWLRFLLVLTSGLTTRRRCCRNSHTEFSAVSLTVGPVYNTQHWKWSGEQFMATPSCTVDVLVLIFMNDLRPDWTHDGSTCVSSRQQWIHTCHHHLSSSFTSCVSPTGFEENSKRQNVKPEVVYGKIRTSAVSRCTFISICWGQRREVNYRG